ncbi:MAG: hypothetical protein RSD49_20995 [Hafnia sp.]
MATLANLFADARHNQYLGTVKLIKGKSFTSDDGEMRSQIARIRLPASIKIDRRNLINGIRHLFERQCNCEHDCCGHFNGGVGKMYVNKREVVVVNRYYKNV